MLELNIQILKSSVEQHFTERKSIKLKRVHTKVVQKDLNITQILDLSYTCQFQWTSPAQKLKQKSELVFSRFIRSGRLLLFLGEAWNF